MQVNRMNMYVCNIGIFSMVARLRLGIVSSCEINPR